MERTASPSNGASLEPANNDPVHPTTASSHSHSLSRQRSTRQSHIRSSSTISEDPEIPRPPRPESPKAPEENAPPPKEEVTKLRLLAHYSGLVLASFLGCLIRLGLTGLGTYDGKVIYALAWSQGIGSGIMGLSLARKNEIISVYPPIYTFLTTGIAGSVTTFSSWMLEGYLSFSNFDKYNRKGLHDTVDGVVYSLSTSAIAIASLRFGEHLSGCLPSLKSLTDRKSRKGSVIPDRIPNSISNGSSTSSEEIRIQSNENSNNDNNSDPDPEKANKKSRSYGNKLSSSQTPIIDLIWISTAFLSYLIILLLYFLGPKNWRHNVIFPLLLAPPGTILRFYLSKLNTKPNFLDKFPIGTFIANILATTIISITFAEQRRPTSQGNIVRCNGLNSIQQGFCGCLSTVSTFVVESRTIKSPKYKWFYLGSSIILGHLIVLAIVGGIGWNQGYVDQCKG
ncbi:uncharacterized protein L201_001630 [Kwoniella dendrophila CBS 6074]|uniref:Chromosome condensation protein CrcB n=1 Tax=Kwoniella dendrophila CBS 6074 TaxID=1295534 RepID=A0AAX4JMV9_9TREE